LSVRTGGYSTTWLGAAYDPRKALDPRFAELVQSIIDHTYGEFITRAAAARKTAPDKIEEVAQGRVWTGAQAKERGLIDRTGSYGDALAAARTRAKLGDDARVNYLERDAGRLERLVEFFSASALQALGLPAAGTWLSAGMPAGATRDMQRELGWVAEVAEQRKPFAAVVHCLCGPVP
jgi:protease-4